MAADMVAVMDQLGFSRFSITGHDRGGRVAYRLALDHPARVERLAVLDIVPTSTVWDHADARFALGFWPWSLLAQPAPLPERILTHAGEAIVDDALANWGSAADIFPADLRAAYADMLHDPDHAHAICEEYRAAASIDRDHDEADRSAGRKIECPLLVLWAAGGSLDLWYADQGGPLALWRDWAAEVQGESVSAGHFFPEEAPEETARLLRGFFSSSAPAGDS